MSASAASAASSSSDDHHENHGKHHGHHGNHGHHAKHQVKPPAHANDILHGVALLYANQFDKASLFFNTVTGINQPRAALLHAFTSFVIASSTYGDKFLETALTDIWNAESLGNKAKTLAGNVVQADAYLSGALVQLIQGSFLKGGWNLRKSWSWYCHVQKQLVSYQTDNEEEKLELQTAVDFGIGFFNLIVSLLPPAILRIVEFIGFSGDRTIAITSLRNAIKHHKSMSPFAALMLLAWLCGISAHTGDMTDEFLSEAEQLLEWAQQNYPGSVFFSFCKQRFFRSKCMLREAVEEAQLAVDASTEIPALKLMSYYQQAWCSFILLDFAPAEKYFASLLADNTAGAKASVQAAYSYQAGLCRAVLAWQTADPQEKASHQKSADQYFKDTAGYVRAGQPVRDIETLSVRRSKLRLDNVGHPVLDSFELLWIMSCYDQMNEETASHCLNLLEQVNEQDGKSFALDEQARYLMAKGCCLKAFKKYEEAELCFVNVMKMEAQLLKSSARAKSDALLPFNVYFRGLLQMELKRFDEAAASLKAAKAYSGYDLNRALSFRLHAFQHMLDRAIKASS